MKTLLKKIVFVLTCVLVFIGCSDNMNGEDNMESYPKDIVIADYELPEGYAWDNVLLLDVVYKMNSQEEMRDHLLTDLILHKIDFEKYSLIVVCGVNAYGIKSISSKLQQTGTNNYNLMVNIESNAAEVLEKWNIAKLVPKMNENVKFAYFLNGEVKTSEIDELCRENIIGHWKLKEISKVYNYDTKNSTTVDYSNDNIIYNFGADNKLNITSSVPGDLSEGEYYYSYTKPDIGILSLPAPNMQIGEEEFIFCIAYKNENTMTISSSKYINDTVIGWSKIFIRMN